MNIIKCANNHFYDSDRFDECPNCKKRAMLKKDNKKIFNLREKHKDIQEVEMNDEPSKLSTWLKSTETSSSGSSDGSFSDYSSNSSEEQAKGYYSPSNTPITEPVVGWLVCTTGFYKGTSYELHCGANSVGRNAGNNIALPLDLNLTADACFTITFEPQNCIFYIMLGKTGSSVSIGGESLGKTVILKNGDIITCGETKFRFIAFCDSNFMWDN